MLRISVRAVHADRVEVLRRWFDEVQGPRRDEALRTLVHETCRHEQAILVFHGDQPLLVYAMVVDDEHQAARSAVSGTHPIDADHWAVMAAVVHSTPPQEVVLDLRP